MAHRPPRSARRFLAWATVALSAGAIAATAPTTATIDDDLQPWVEQLAASDPAERAAAERRLAAAGSRVIPTLTAARTDPRPEVAARAARALRRVRLFALHGSTPAETANVDAALALAAEYLSAESPPARAVVLNRLVELQPLPTAVLVRLMSLEPDAGLRSQLLAAVGSGYRQAVAGLVADGDAAALAPLLEESAAELSYVGAPDYAMNAWLTHGWDEAVARWRAELANGPQPQQALSAGILCYLYRVASKPDEAAAMARRAADPRLVLLTAIDRADGPAASTAAGACWRAPRAAALQAGLSRLADRPADVTAAVAGVTAAPVGADADAISVGKVRLLLDDVAGGMATLTADPANGGDPAAAFRLLQVRGEYDAALALAARFAKDPVVGPALAPLRDDLLRDLGELPAAAASQPSATADAAGTADDPAWTRAVADLSAHRFAAAAADLSLGEHDADRFDWRFARGFALDAAGDGAGAAMMRDASLVPLGDANRRLWLSRRLASAGLADAAAAQRSLAARVGNPFLEPVAVLELAAADRDAAVRAHDWPAAVAATERVWLLSFWPGLSWKDPADYLAVPADVHLTRAEAARARDDWGAVRAELAAADALAPFSINAPLEWVPLLDGRGDHGGADAVFTAVYDRVDADAVRHPRSAHLHNQAAWLAACCGRRLDAAAAHAEAAVRLTGGQDWQFVDTLAECRFRAGDRAAAADLDRRAAGLPGVDAGYVRRQLDRFARSAVPSTTQPSAAPQ